MRRKGPGRICGGFHLKRRTLFFTFRVVFFGTKFILLESAQGDGTGWIWYSSSARDETETYDINLINSSNMRLSKTAIKDGSLRNPQSIDTITIVADGTTRRGCRELILNQPNTSSSLSKYMIVFWRDGYIVFVELGD